MKLIRLVLILFAFFLLSSCSLNTKILATDIPQSTVTPDLTNTPDDEFESENNENEYIEKWNEKFEQALNSYEKVGEFFLVLENDPEYIPNEAWLSDFHKAVDTFEKDLDTFCNISPVPNRFISVSQNLKLANSEFKIAFKNFQEFGTPNENALNQFVDHWYDGMGYFQKAWDEFNFLTMQ